MTPKKSKLRSKHEGLKPSDTQISSQEKPEGKITDGTDGLGPARIKARSESDRDSAALRPKYCSDQYCEEKTKEGNPCKFWALKGSHMCAFHLKRARGRNRALDPQNENVVYRYGAIGHVAHEVRRELKQKGGCWNLESEFILMRTIIARLLEEATVDMQSLSVHIPVIGELTDLLRKLSATHSRNEQERIEKISGSQAQEMIRLIIDVVHEEVPDPAKKRRIASRIQKVLATIMDR